jgi:peptidoglycan/LPS O-acetylase OafA/YrhL
MSFEEVFNRILDRLTSQEREVLEYCKAYLIELTAEENNRSRRAEDKAQVVLNICGVGATLLIGFAGFLWSRVSSSDILVILVPLISAVVLIAKSVFFNLRTLQPMQNNEANTELVFDVQEKDFVEALRYDIAVRIWLYDMNRQFHTSKVFYLHRAIRNLAGFIVAVLITSLVSTFLLTRANWFLHSRWMLGFSVALLLFSLLLDPLSERFGKLWVRRENLN